MNDLLFPIFEIRPLPGEFREGECFRYADGEWTPDDGEWDLAFAGSGAGKYSYAPIVIGVELPYHRDIAWKWLTCHWTSNVPEHPGGNPWHYALRDGAKSWGESWARDSHPNEQVHRRGMNWLSARRGCANGRRFDFMPTDKRLLAGLIRDAETKVVLAAPQELTCMYGCNWSAECRPGGDPVVTETPRKAARAHEH